MYNLIRLDNPVLTAYLFYASILIGKTLLMAPLTSIWRFRKKVFITPEDSVLYPKGSKNITTDSDVERVRRAHLNDLENIPVFLVTGLIYTLTNPIPFVAINLFRVFTACRIIHTYVYAIKVFPQPTRVTVWSIGYCINWYMVAMSVLRFL